MSETTLKNDCRCERCSRRREMWGVFGNVLLRTAICVAGYLAIDLILRLPRTTPLQQGFGNMLIVAAAAVVLRSCRLMRFDFE
jgi:hypothetical protein